MPSNVTRQASYLQELDYGLSRVYARWIERFDGDFAALNNASGDPDKALIGAANGATSSALLMADEVGLSREVAVDAVVNHLRVANGVKPMETDDCEEGNDG